MHELARVKPCKYWEKLPINSTSRSFMFEKEPRNPHESTVKKQFHRSPPLNWVPTFDVG